MAKKAKAGPVAVPNGISKDLARAIEKVRKPFMDYVKTWNILQESRAKLAPAFMAAFEDWKKETGRIQFVEFLRTKIDPSIPNNGRDNDAGAGYRSHKSYQAADYLRRLVARTDTAENGRRAPIRSSAWRMARLLATVVALVPEKQRSEFWTEIATEFDLGNAQIGTLRRMTLATQPLIEVHAKPQPLKVVHVEVADTAKAVENAA